MNGHRATPRTSAAILLLLLVAALPAGTSEEAAACDWETGNHTVVVDGTERTYQVSVTDPDGPVVLSLHRALDNPDSHEAHTRFTSAGEGVVITPASEIAVWQHRVEDSPDVDFLADLLCGDDVHAVGFSSGGMMAMRLACDGLVDSAVVVGAMVELEPCDRHPPLLVIHGTDDDKVGWDGTIARNVAVLTGYEKGPTVPELVDAWGPAELVAHDGGHTWPDGTSERAWDFIAEQR